jgi:DNA-binding beta-propeller fold protein YncE
VSVVDLTHNKVTDTVPFSGNPALIRLSPEGRQAYVAGHTDLQGGLVAVVDTAARTVSAKIDVEGGLSVTWSYRLMVGASTR